MKGALTERLFQLAIMSMALSIYQLYLQDAFLSLWGENVGFGEVSLGYFFVAVISWVTAMILTRNLRQTAEEEY